MVVEVRKTFHEPGEEKLPIQTFSKLPILCSKWLSFFYGDTFE